MTANPDAAFFDRLEAKLRGMCARARGECLAASRRALHEFDLAAWRWQIEREDRERSTRNSVEQTA